jgi:TetR/AcrR family transcriptional regulator
MAIEKETEEKIFIAAQRVFQEKGFSGARMQEIADEAAINKSMLHYYYRSKEKLFLKVFQNSVKRIFPEIMHILGSDQSLRAKVESIVDFYYQTFRQNPFLPAFVVHEMNQNPVRFREFMETLNIQLPVKFIEQIQGEIEKGRMMPIKPHQFLMNVVGLCMMPFMVRNMVQVLFRLDEKAYWDFLEERRKLIPKLIFSGVQP